LQEFSNTSVWSASISPVRPPAQPPLAETPTGALARRRPPKDAAPKAPAAAGDVYAVRIREGAWVTVYCHETGLRGKNVCARMEYLDGVYADMLAADELKLRYRGRGNGRWQHWSASLDSTPWVRRVARGVPPRERTSRNRTGLSAAARRNSNTSRIGAFRNCGGSKAFRKKEDSNEERRKKRELKGQSPMALL
jgi:hypothetical protein